MQNSTIDHSLHALSFDLALFDRSLPTNHSSKHV